MSDDRAESFRYEFRLEPASRSVGIAGAAVAEVAVHAGLDGSPATQLRCLVEEIVRQSIDRIGDAETDPVVVEVVRHGTLLETRVGSGVSIGNNATILPGIDIGDGAVIGAGAVVTRSVPPGATVLGPAMRFK